MKELGRRLGLAALVGLAGVAFSCRPSTSPRPSDPVTVTRVASVAVVAGTSGDYPPWSTWTSGQPDGLAPSLFRAFATAASYEPRWTKLSWSSVANDLREGRFEIAVDGMTVRPERSIAGRFTIPIAAGGAVLLVRRPTWATTSALAELDRPSFRVAVNRGGHLERVARDKLRSATLTTIADNGAVRELLVRREVDAVMTNTFEAPRWAAGLEGVERIGPLTSDLTAFWVRADRADLAERLDAWLTSEEESGRLLEARAKWLGEGAGPPAASPAFALLAATAERLALMPWVAAAKEKAGLPVEDLAQESAVLAASKAAVEKNLAARGEAPRPDPSAVERFFRLQIELAKVAQVRAPLSRGPGGASDRAPPSLEEELRPAIARISAKMAFLVTRVPAGTNPSWTITTARTVLADSGLDVERIDEMARAITALAPVARYR